MTRRFGKHLILLDRNPQNAEVGLIMESFKEAIRLYKHGRVEDAKAIIFTAYLEAVSHNRQAVPVTKEFLQEQGISIRGFYQLLMESRIPLTPEAEAYFLNETAFDIGRQGEFEEALRLLKRAADLNPKNADVWYNIGGFSFEMHNYKDALEAYTKVLSIEPNNESVKNLVIQARRALE